MITRLYAHNFRCLVNFELALGQYPSVLLIGKNGAGKTTIRRVLEILQKFARGTNRVNDVVTPSERTLWNKDEPMRFEIEASIGSSHFKYSISMKYPEGFRELQIATEVFEVNGKSQFLRDTAKVTIPRGREDDSTHFNIDWHLAALPIVQDRGEDDPLFVFKRWLSRMMILQPIPSLITGDSEGETFQPRIDVADFGKWFSGLFATYPESYSTMATYLKEVLPDFKSLRNQPTGRNAKTLEVQFSIDGRDMVVPFNELSDGEKCFMICAMVLAANETYGPLVCFWDEPDNHLSLSEVGHFAMNLRKAFEAKKGQFIATSHNPETINQFTGDSTVLIFRRSHLEPTDKKQVSALQLKQNLVTALVLDDIRP